MKLISYNIQYGFGGDGRYDLSRAARIVAGADIIALQEVERHWQRSNEDDQPELLSRLLPDYHWVYGPAFDMDASERRGRPSGQPPPAVRHHGAVEAADLWSRLHALPLRRTLRPLNTRNAALECMIRTPAGPVRVLSLHLAAYRAPRSGWSRSIISSPQHRRAPSEGGPWSGTDDEPARNWGNGEPEPESPLAAIWMGDFNMEPGSAEYRRIVGSTPYHRGAAYLDGIVDAAVVAASRRRTSTRMRRSSTAGGKAPARPLLCRRHVCRARALGQRRYRRSRFGPFSGTDRHRPGDAGPRHDAGGG